MWRRQVAASRPPDQELYRPLFEPWRAKLFESVYQRVAADSLLSRDRAWVLQTTLRQALNTAGAVYELGVFRGGSAVLLQQVIQDSDESRPLRLFDTFAGMPETDPVLDRHMAGDFSDTSEAHVRSLFEGSPNVDIRKGWIPETFTGLEGEQVCFAHVDLDIYRSILDTCEFLYPRLTSGAVIVFDDYGFPSCPGARQAVDEFFADKPEAPLVLSSGQAIVHRLPH